MATTQKIDVSKLGKETTRVVDVYRRARNVYERTTMAMGRGLRSRITVASTTTVVGDVKHRTS